MPFRRYSKRERATVPENPLAQFVRDHLDVELTPWQQDMLTTLWNARAFPGPGGGKSALMDDPDGLEE